VIINSLKIITSRSWVKSVYLHLTIGYLLLIMQVSYNEKVTSNSFSISAKVIPMIKADSLAEIKRFGGDLYINGKTSQNLTLEDLKIDSPYNTYRYAGLPIGPISNPGLDAIRAAVNAIDSEYLYFLTDNEGVMHYSKTLSEHEAKTKRYLK
jgi:hypothetical protein